MRTPTMLIICGKDLRQQLRNGTLLWFALVLPLGLAFLFNTITPDDQDEFHTTFAVTDQDGGPAARAFIDDMLAGVATDGNFDIHTADTIDQAQQLIAAGDAGAAFLLPAGFSSDIQAGRTAQLQVLGDAEAPIAAHIAEQLAESYATEIRSVQLAVAVTLSGQPDQDPATLAEQAQQVPTPLAMQTDPSVADRQLDTQTYYAAGMAVFFIFFVAMLSVSSIIQERSTQTMSRLLAAPTSPAAILAGKLLAGVGIGLAAMLVLVSTSTLLFGASWGPPLGVAALVIAVVLSATGLMALIATIARTTEQATNWMSVLAVLLGLFGGSFVPLAQLGDLAAVSYATPHRWFLQGLSDLVVGDLAVVVTPALVLLAFAAATFTLTALRIRKVITP